MYLSTGVYFKRMENMGVILDLRSEVARLFGIAEQGVFIWEGLAKGMSLSEIEAMGGETMSPDVVQSTSQYFIQRGFFCKVLEPVTCPKLIPRWIRIVPLWLKILVLLRCVERALHIRYGLLALMTEIMSIVPGERWCGQQERVRLVAVVNRLSLFTQFRSECLHQSMVLCYLFRQCGIDAHVVIGCSTHPFVSHAWVQVGEEILQWKAGMGPFTGIGAIEAMDILFSSHEVKP